jgi:hypothetical protein
MANDPVADALASAKDFLANSKFKSATPAPLPKPVVKPKPATTAGDTLGKDLEEKKKMTDKAKEAAGSTSGMPKMHKGGVVKEDGPHDLEKGEIVIPKDKAMKKSAGLMDGMKEAADEKAEPKDKKKEKHDKPAGKSRYHHTTVHHHDNGSHTTTHHAHPSEDGKPGEDITYASEDHDGMMNGMMEHTSEPNPGEAEADAGQSGIEGEQAPPQGA